MKEKHELENQILGIFQEKGKGASKIVLQMLKPTTSLKNVPLSVMYFHAFILIMMEHIF